jgi:hypothetical protein
LLRFLRQVGRSLGPQPLSIVHIGSGNGREIPLVVESLGAARIASYALIDISASLLHSARSVALAHLPKRIVRSFVHDASVPGIKSLAEGLRKRSASRTLFLMIGNGGILANETVLELLLAAMRPSDFLVITLETYSRRREREILGQYRIPSILRLFAQPLRFLGFKTPSARDFEFSYDRVRGLIEVYLRQPRRRGTTGASSLQLPDRMRVFASLRLSPERFRSYLVGRGAHVLKYARFNRERCCAALVRASTR